MKTRVTLWGIAGSFVIALVLPFTVLLGDFVQSPPAAAAGELGQWTATTALPATMAAHGSIGVNGRVYVAGGFNSSGAQSAVYMATPAADGSIAAWQTTTPLPAGRFDFVLVEARGYLWVIGGTPDSLASSVIRSQIQADGTLGAWTTMGNILAPRGFPAGAVYNNRIYIAGGQVPGGSPSVTNTVFFATVSVDGSLSAWQSALPMNANRANLNLFANGGFLYAFGAYNSGNTQVERAAIQSDGTIGPWSVIGNTNLAHQSAAAGQIGSYIYAVGGVPHSTSNGEYSQFQTDGSLGSWAPAPAYPLALSELAAAVVGARIYVTGGQKFDASAVNNVYYAQQASLTTTFFDPPSVGLGGPGSSAIVTVKVTGLDPGADGVQLNVQHNKTLFSVTGPQCAGVFGGGSATGPSDVTGGTVIGCFLISGDVSGASGEVMKFTLNALQTFTSPQQITFGLGGGFGTQYSNGGAAIAPGTTNIPLAVEPGKPVKGATTLQFRSDTAGQVKVCLEASGFTAKCVIAGTDGSWQIPGVPPGTYSVTASAFSYLSATKTGVVMGAAEVVLGANQLRGGDINGDGFVNINDITGAVTNFGKSSPQAWP